MDAMDLWLRYIDSHQDAEVAPEGGDDSQVARAKAASRPDKALKI